jgi:hypothetical protein
MRYAKFSIYILCLLAASAKADQFCFALAETYYEQVYCQLQAKAQTKGLPPFNQFKKNNEMVQASLLKRPAGRNGIKLPAPAREVQVQIIPISPSPSVNKPQVSAAELTKSEPIPEVARKRFSDVEDSAECELLGNQIRCANQSFKLVGNRANHRLVDNALSLDNKMNLPSYQGGALSQYLNQAYGQYISKMCDIGLCGVTMTYGKFAYLYQDLHSKGLDFAQRFEIMYGFLKKDKANMGVSESSNIPKGLSVQDCSPLTDARYVCDFQGRNYIFELP